MSLIKINDEIKTFVMLKYGHVIFNNDILYNSTLHEFLQTLPYEVRENVREKNKVICREDSDNKVIKIISNNIFDALVEYELYNQADTN